MSNNFLRKAEWRCVSLLSSSTGADRALSFCDSLCLLGCGRSIPGAARGRLHPYEFHVGDEPDPVFFGESEFDRDAAVQRRVVNGIDRSSITIDYYFSVIE